MPQRPRCRRFKELFLSDAFGLGIFPVFPPKRVFSIYKKYGEK